MRFRFGGDAVSVLSDGLANFGFVRWIKVSMIAKLLMDSVFVVIKREDEGFEFGWELDCG